MDDPRPAGRPELHTFVLTVVHNAAHSWRLDETAFAQALAEHDDLVQRGARDHGGQSLRHLDEGFLVVFGEAADAGRFARDLQHALLRHPWPANLPAFRVKLGLHRGRARVSGDDYRGPDVALTGEIAALCPPGQIRASQAAVVAMRQDERLADTIIPLGWGGLPSAPAMELYKLRVVAPSAPSGLRAALTDREYRRWRRARESLRQADPQAALRRLLPLCRHHPEQVRLLTVLGVAYAMAEEPGKARTCLRRALQIDPAHAPAWFNLARIYGRLGRKRKMLGCLAQALKANPRHAKARKAAARYGLALPPLPSDDPLAWEAPAAEPWWGPASGPSFEDFAGPDPAG